MVGKKKISAIIMIALATSILGGCGASKTTSLKDKKQITIGITQIIEHPALDSARKGFIAALKEKGFEDGKNIKIDYQNAQGDMPTAQTIAQSFVSQKKDLILAIATPTAQAAYNATKDIPILITAVTDPVKSGLAKSLEKPDTNVTGTSDDVSIDKQFELIKQLLPNAKKVGIIYNTSEANSEIQVEAAKKSAPKFGFEIITSGITNVNEISQSLNSILDKIDVLYVPTDNAVVSSIPLIVKTCYAKNIAVIGSESGQVDNGALATTGIDYYKLGYQTGLMAVDVINGKSTKDMPIQTLKEMQLVINEDAAKKLNITIPQELKDKAKMVKGGVN